MNARIVVSTFCVLVWWASLSARAQDLDADGIPDEFEDELLQRFAPIFKRNGLATEPEEFLAIPVNASWFVRHTDLVYDTDMVVPHFIPVLTNPTPEAVLIASISNKNDVASMWLKFRDAEAKWGDSTTEPSSWSNAIAQGHGVYGRVWKPWPESHPELYSVQYFMLLTWSEPATVDPFFGEEYRHDGDLMCVDFGVDTSWPGGPTIVHAIYHNHGRQLFMTREGLLFENGHPLVFMERGNNEPWPNAGGGDSSGWPRTKGFALTALGTDCFPDDTFCIAAHWGEGNVYPARNVPNIGDAPWPNEPDQFAERAFLPLGNLDAQLFLQYPGGWGFRGSAPRGPSFQGKMWRRQFNGPWAWSGPRADQDPARPDVENPHLTVPASAVNMTNIVFHHFLPVCTVSNGYLGEERGWPSKPFAALTNGLENVATYGVLRVGAGTYSNTVEISKPMQIESVGGLVTIGQ